MSLSVTDLEKACQCVEELRKRLEDQQEVIELMALHDQKAGREDTLLGILQVSLAEAAVRRDVIERDLRQEGVLS